MKFLTRLQRGWTALTSDPASTLGFRADAGVGVTLPPWDDFFFTTRGYQTATGLRVSPESALRIAAVFACVRVVSETVASLPCIIYKRLPNGGKERATNHPLYKIMHDRPNQLQTAFEFWEMMQGHLELRGNAYAEIISANGRVIDELQPIHPDRVIVKRLPSGRLQYEIRSYFGSSIEVKTQDEILHFRGISSDGLVGMSTIGVMAESIGAGLAAQEFAARFFENDSTPSGVLTHPKSLTEAAHERIKKSWRDAHSGAMQHSVAVIEEGMTYANIGISNKDSQLLEARQFSRADIASGFRVPLHKIGDLTRATFSNIEQQNIEFATDCIRPRAVRIERRINSYLIDALNFGNREEYFCEFLLEALMRGDQPSRYRSYAIGRQWGWLSPNEIRAMENQNPIANGGDDYLTPLNMAPTAADDPSKVDDKSDQQEDTTSTGARYRDFVHAAAERVVRKEVKALARIAKVANGHFNEQVEEFYRNHSSFVASTMRLSAKQAQRYAEDNAKSLYGVTDPTAREMLIAHIEEHGPKTLAAMALQQVQ